MRRLGRERTGEQRFWCAHCHVFIRDGSSRAVQKRYQKIIAPEVRAERRQRVSQIGNELLELIRSELSYSLRYDMREDVIQETALALLSGEVDLSELPEVIPVYARRIFRLSANKFNSVPLDAVIPGTENLTYAELLAG